MIPPFTQDGNLPPGIHIATFTELQTQFGFSSLRYDLLTGLEGAINMFKQAKVTKFYLDGSFVTRKPFPSDYDACWDVNGVEQAKVDPLMFDFSNKRIRQKARYGGEFFPAHFSAGPGHGTFLEFFQKDKITGLPKGIVLLNL